MSVGKETQEITWDEIQQQGGELMDQLGSEVELGIGTIKEELDNTAVYWKLIATL